MNAKSCEYQLQHTIPPALHPAARLDARRAALVEFERIHGQPTHSSEAVLSSAVRPTAARRASRSLFAGIATACVAVLAVSVVWLMPSQQRQVQLRVPVDIDSQSKGEVTSQIEKRPESAMTVPLQTKGEPARDQKQSPPVAPRPVKQPNRAEALEEVAVTGSRIREIFFDSVAPVPLDETLVASGLQTNMDTTSFVPGGSSNTDALLQASEGRDQFQHFEPNPVKRVADEPVSTFSVDVDTASYSYVRRELNEDTLPEADAVRSEEMINYFDYAWPAPGSRARPFQPTVTISDSPWNAGKKLIHIGIKGYELPSRERPDVNLVLLLDVSGSMDEPDRLPLAQQSMVLLLDRLQPTDTVGIVVYAGAAGMVLEPTPVANKATILQALLSLRAGGSTAGAEGIRLAYELAAKNFRKDGVNRILLATDGDFNVGITDSNALKEYVSREREKGIFLSVFGFGQGNYRDELAQVLAQNGNGVAAYIDTLNEAKKVLVQESTASLFPIAKDVKLQIEFNPATVREYRLIGYETRALNREDFDDDTVDAGDIGSGHTVTAIYEIAPTGVKAKLIGRSRYATGAAAAAMRRGKVNEYGYLRIRYKLPDGSRSRLLEQPILVNAGVPAGLEQDVEFSTAVAGFAQLLRGGQYTRSLSFEDVIESAQGSLGKDPYGYRAELVELVRKAQRALVCENPASGDAQECP